MNPPAVTHIAKSHKPTHKPKLVGSVCLPPTHGRQKRCSKLKRKMTENKEHQPLTSVIKYWGLSGYSSILPRIKFSVTGQESSPQSPTILCRRLISYTHAVFNY